MKMNSFTKVICVCALTFGVLCAANPVKHAAEDLNVEDNEIQREKRQMKGATATGEQAEVKFLGAGQMLASTANGALQAVVGAANNNLQGARFSPYGNALMLQGGYANMPGLNYGANGGVGGIGGIGGLPFNPNAGGLGVGGSLANYPSGLEMYPAYMYGGGIYPNAGAPFTPNQLGVGGIPPLGGGPLDNFGPQGGLNTQLLAQQSQLQPQQIAPYPVMPGYFPQMGYSPAFQNFLG